MKKVQFTLPVGALLGPLRHLGDGKFIADYDDLASGITGTLVPGQTFGLTLENPTGHKFEAVPLEAVLDPHDDEPVLAEAGAPFVLTHQGAPVFDPQRIEALLCGRVH